MFPAIEPSEVGLTGLLWLFFSYGYVLYYASNLISEGSELLLLVPSMAGLVGGVVLPLLGAVPDGAIILFSGLGDLETAQETLAVGVGALAGSTIMLLTIPLGLSIYGGRVDLISGSNGGGDSSSNTLRPNYLGKPKLTDKSGQSLLSQLRTTGVAVTGAVQSGGTIMMLTTLPYFLIQVPANLAERASAAAGETKNETAEVAAHEHWWALAGLLVCVSGLIVYMKLQLDFSKQGMDKGKRMAVMKKKLKEGKLSLSGAVATQLREKESALAKQAASEYQSMLLSGSGSGGNYNAISQSTSVQNTTRTNTPAGGNVNNTNKYPSPAVAEFLKEVLAEAFYTYDYNGNGLLDRREVFVFFRDFNEMISEEEMDRMFTQYDTDKSGFISLDEFIGLAYTLIKTQESRGPEGGDRPVHHGNNNNNHNMHKAAMAESAFSELEEEEVPEEFTDLSPDQQQTEIKKRAFLMLGTGTLMVVLFSDPMVDVMQEIAVRASLPPFYVSFVLAPLASNASEVLSSMYYASKKTSKTITVSLSALEGAAAMNNTFCLSIFMGLVFFRGLAWQYTAETIAIVAVELIVGWFVRQNEYLTMLQGLVLMSLFPLSIVVVAGLEAMGFD